MTRKELVANLTAEFLPIAAFVFTSETVGFPMGLRVLIITTVITFFLSVIVERRLPKFGLFASGTILFFAGLSIFFHDPFFIILKDTLYYFGFGLALFVGIVIGKFPFKFFFSDFLAITERGWRLISIRWSAFFFLLAVGNEVARHFLHPVDWTVYKLIVLILTWIFGFYQLTVTRRERLPNASPIGLRIEKNPMVHESEK